MYRPLARWLLLAALATAVLGQSEDEPYFALNSGNTFGSNGKPSISLTAWNVDSLEFRVYHINDPVEFFHRLENPHEFGGRAPRPPHQRTLLERIHAWKSGLRAGIRRSLRAQFTEPPSDHLASLLPGRTPPPTAKGTHYAEAPVLNPQQLVLTFVQPVRTRSRWGNQTVPLDLRRPGVYLVEAVRGSLSAYTILMVSDIVLTNKTGAGRIVSFVVDRNTGEPVPGAEIVTMLRDGPTNTVRTNTDGIAESKIPDLHSDDVRIVARKDAHIAVDSMGAYAFELSTPQWMGYIYTDRPVYRPGHTVHFKAILRLRSPSGYQVPAGKSMPVEIQDPEQKPVYRKTLTLSANGTIHDDLVLAPGAALGNYTIEIHSGAEGQTSGDFQVEEYKKPEYEVRVTPATPRILEGAAAQATIDAHYYFGEPVAGAKVQYAVYRNRYWFPLWYSPDDESGPPPDGDNDYGEEQILQEEGQLDANGQLSVSFPTTVSDHKIDYRYRVEARVTDEARREIVGRGSVLATYGTFLVNVTPERYFYPAGQRGSFTVEARDYDNKPMRTRVHVELFQWQPRERSYGKLMDSTDVLTGEDGAGKAEFLIPAAGSYRVRVSAKTPEGREVEQTAFVWSPGGTSAGMEESTRGTLQMIPDKKSYEGYETAQIMIVTGRANTPLFVTIEGRDLRSCQLIRSPDTAVQFSVPIKPADEPGFYVTAQFLRGGNLYQANKYIKVVPLGHQMNVTLETDKPQYLPGETALYRIRATDPVGNPVPRAEFSLGVVDEAIYAIRRDYLEDPLSFFFGHEWNGVFTGNSLAYYFNGEAGKRRMRLAELRPASRLAQLKPERLVQPKVRKAFPDTAFWAADVTTDSAGRAQAKVEFPDSLTTWRATARGVTAEDKLGGAVLKTIVRKNLILRLAVPRFFVQGDEVVISALVHNYLATPKKARVSLDLKGLDALEGATKDIDIPTRGEVRVDWRVRAQQVRSATVTGKALTDEESDALELELPVNIPGVKLSTARGGTLSAGASTAFDVAFPANVAPGSRSLSIQMAPSIAGSLFGALEYLTSYPYGCVEQTMSSFLPNIVVTQAMRDLGLKVDLDQAALQEKIRAGLDRLYGLQHDDGGWGWWETDESQPFMTAYVVAGLAQAQAAGLAVKPEAIPKGAAWVLSSFQKDARLAADLRAYMVYALAMAARTDATAVNQVYEQRGKLSPYGLALLGLALELNKDARAADLAAALEAAAQQDQEQAWWPATRDQLLDFTEDATPESTAYAVKFLSHQRPASALLPKAALWLMNHRNEGYWWSSTKQTAMVIYGLTDFLKAANELNPNLTATVYVNDRAVLTRKFDQATDIANPAITIDESKLDAAVNHVRVTTSGQGRLYFSTRAESYSTEDKLQKTGSVALNVVREYFRLVPVQEGGRIVYDTTPLAGPVAAGDTLAVRLTVTGAEWKYLMLEDPIPAGAEFIQRDSAYELRQRPPWWGWWFTRRELHDDRMTIFQTWFPAGQQEYFYLLKVVNPGAFHISPARVQPMYQPGLLSTTESRRLEVK